MKRGTTVQWSIINMYEIYNYGGDLSWKLREKVL